MLNASILCLSLFGTIIAGLTGYLNPAWRWQELRAAALDIESQIWEFRTRTGPYREGRGTVNRNAEDMLQNMIKSQEEGILESADLKHTAFYAKSHRSGYSSRYKHDQFEKTSKTCFEKICTKCLHKKRIKPSIQLEMYDNHHSPVKPSLYINTRLEKSIKFYNKCIQILKMYNDG